MVSKFKIIDAYERLAKFAVLQCIWNDALRHPLRYLHCTGSLCADSGLCRTQETMIFSRSIFTHEQEEPR
jgi:hypothetical protein